MSTKSKNLKPRYYIDERCTMLYAVYADTCYFYLCSGEWKESGPSLVPYFNDNESYSPCSLRDVAAAFPGVIPHKRISNNTLAGTNPA